MTSSYVVIADTHIEIMGILRHYFKLGLEDGEDVCRIWEVEVNETISDSAEQKWFKLASRNKTQNPID